MRIEYDAQKLAKQVRTKRLIELDLGVREAAILIGVSPATLSRVENGKEPDINTLAKICMWIKQPVDSFFITK